MAHKLWRNAIDLAIPALGLASIVLTVSGMLHH
jgi:hypothetical protein